MDSSPNDVLMLNGVVEIVNALLEFKPVGELFHHHLQRWRKKYCLFEKQRVKVKAQLAEFWRDEPQTPDPYQAEYWPARRIYSPDRTKSELFPIPLKLDFKLRRYEGPIRRHSLRSLHKKQNFTLAESFILLAELHDAAYSQLRLGEEKEFMAGVAEATEMLAIGLSQAAVVNLKALFQRVLDRIEALADSRSRNKSEKTLQEIMLRCRETLADLVIRSRPNSVTPPDLESVQVAVEKLRSDVKASLMITESAAKHKVFIPSRKASRRKKPRGSKEKSDTLIQNVLKSGKSELIYKWVFANKDHLAELCGCSPGTVMKTEFWKQNRASEQKKWNRENGRGRPKRKSET